MKKIVLLILLTPLLALFQMRAESMQFSVNVADLGFATTDNLNELSPISLNEDIEIVFEGGNTYAKYASAGYFNISPNATIKVQGKSEDVKIEEIIFDVYKKSYRLTDPDITPDGELTYDEDNVRNIWKATEAANEVVFKLYFDGPRITNITVKYTKAGADAPETPENPGETVTKEMTVNVADLGFATTDNLNELSPISLNEDIQIVFEGGNTNAKYASAGYITVAPNATIKVQGKSEDVKIEEIIFDVYKKSYRLTDPDITPDGELTYDEDNVRNIWKATDAANEVVFKLYYDGPRITNITVKYTKAGAEAPETPENPGETVTKEMTVNVADLGFATTDNLNDLSPISLNEDIQIVFEGGNTYAKYASAGYFNISPNATIKVQGKSEDVKIEEIIFDVYKKSYRLTDPDITPEGELTYDEDNVRNIWKATEAANEVVFKLYFDGPRITNITVKYTKAGAEAPETPENPGETVTKEMTVNVADLGFATTDNLNELSPISLNEDIQIVFEGGNTNAKYASAGYITVAPNTTIKLQGKSEDVKIEEIIFDVYKKSYRLTDPDITPEGELTYDEDNVRNIWKATEAANEVVFKLYYDGPRITNITVKYTGGKAAGGDKPGEPDEPVEPETPEDDNLLSTGFTTTAEFNQFTIINVQEGSNTWKHSTGNPYAKIENDLGNTIPKDDYLVSPALELKAGKTYRLTFDTWCGSPAYPEIVAAYLLKGATNITDKTVIIEPTEVTNDTNRKRELAGYFSVDKDGTYYVAIHAASEPGMHYLYVDNVEISRGVSALNPAEPASYNVKPSTLGENEVTVTFEAPQICFDGVTPLSDIKSFTVKRDGETLTELTFDAGQKQYSVNDKVEKEGWYSYSVTVNAATGKSLDAKKTVYVGQARPSSPTNLQVKEIEIGTVELEWEAVTTNVYGFEIDSSLVTYNIYDGPYSLLEQGVAENKATIEYVTEGEAQKIPTFSVKAVTAKGESAEAAESTPIPIGAPHTMPYAETFANSHITAGQPAEFISDEKLPLTYWRCFEEVADADIIPVKFDRGLLAFYANETGRTGIYRTGKIQIDADASNPYLSFFYFVIPGAEDHFTVSINEDVAEDIVIDGEERGWTEKLISLEQYKGQIIRLTLTAYCVNPANPIAVDDIAIRNEINNDLAISRARIPYEMLAGQEHNCSVKVTNLGVYTSGNYTVNILADDEIINSFEGTGLERGKTEEFSFAVTPNGKFGESVVYTIELCSDAEEKEEDNVVETEVSVANHNLPSPQNLSMNGTVLTWSEFDEFDYPTRTITESFESYDEFAINNAGEWSFYDGDSYPTFGMEDGYHSYPNIYDPMAFMVFNNHDNFFVGMGTMSFEMIDGGQCMVSMAINCANRIERANDDWLISPELSGEAQTITFFARGTSLIFRETFQVLYTTSDDAYDFNSYKLLQTYEDVDSTWVEYSHALPEGAKYFAIRNCSLNQYMLFVDKVKFVAAPSRVAVEGYDVYLSSTNQEEAEWTKLNEELLTDTQLALDNLAERQYTKVHAHFANGVETVSAPYEILKSGIESVMVEDSNTSRRYYNVNGVELSRRPTAPGVYMVRDGNVTRKIVIGR